VDYLHENNSFLELEQSCVPNNTVCSTNSTIELLYGGVCGVELEKREQSSAKTPRNTLSDVSLKFFPQRALLGHS